MSTAGASILGVGYLLPLDLSDLVAALRKKSAGQSVERHRSGMADAFAAAGPKLLETAGCHRGAYEYSAEAAEKNGGVKHV